MGKYEVGKPRFFGDFFVKFGKIPLTEQQDCDKLKNDILGRCSHLFEDIKNCERKQGEVLIAPVITLHKTCLKKQSQAYQKRR